MTLEFYSSTGKTPKPWRLKINPIWWFKNDDEPEPPEWYKLEQPRFTTLKWYLRNPFQNFGKWVLGVEDRNFTAYGPAPLLTTTWWEVNGSSGWKWSIIKLPVGCMALRLPFVSFENSKMIFYAGWQPCGFFGFKLHPKGKGLW